MKEIRRAENAGFCFGVKQAIEKAEKAAEQNPGEIYSMGSLIHNERVTRDLEKRGIRVIESLDEISAPGTVKDGCDSEGDHPLSWGRQGPLSKSRRTRYRIDRCNLPVCGEDPSPGQRY